MRGINVINIQNKTIYDKLPRVLNKKAVGIDERVKHVNKLFTTGGDLDSYYKGINENFSAAVDACKGEGELEKVRQGYSKNLKPLEEYADYLLFTGKKGAKQNILSSRTERRRKERETSLPEDEYGGEENESINVSDIGKTKKMLKNGVFDDKDFLVLEEKDFCESLQLDETEADIVEMLIAGFTQAETAELVYGSKEHRQKVRTRRERIGKKYNDVKIS